MGRGVKGPAEGKDHDFRELRAGGGVIGAVGVVGVAGGEVVADEPVDGQ